MKQITTFILLVLGLTMSHNAICQTLNPVKNALYSNELLISPRAGFDLPFFNNNTPYIDYKGGLELGISVDYYWKKFGVGADFDYIKNKPLSVYPTTNLYTSTLTPISKFTLSEGGITRMFYGIGPDYRWINSTTKLMFEFNTRIGLGSIKGGETFLLGSATPPILLNYHAGYDVKNKLATKAQVRGTYWLKDRFGIHLGAYYLRHFGVTELQDPTSLMSSFYYPVTQVAGNNIMADGPDFRNECNCSVSSAGVFAGITFKVKSKNSKEKYSLTVTARDKFNSEVLPNTDVALKNNFGEIVATGTTNAYGVVVFNDIKPDDYLIEGILNKIDLQGNATTTDEFVANETLQKEILYTDEDFILEGRAVVCNTSEGIPGVKVTLKNTLEGVQKSTFTNNDGVYILKVKQDKIYTIYGQKEMYFSQTETVNTSNFNRNTTLFVKLEICMEEVNCDEALALKNIHYDVNKSYIRADAKPELDRLVQFMIDNPSVTVELSSHTDSRSSSEYNQTLSQTRAEAAVDYMISQGISKSRLTGIGYGESRLLNECGDGVHCSESQHQKNRRTEMKVFCNE